MAIVRRDKMLAGYNGNLEHVRVVSDKDATTKTNVEVTNGVFVLAGDFIEAGEREARFAELVGDANRAEGEILLVHAPEVQYDERPTVKLRDFKNEAGKVVRAFRLYKGDIITLTSNLFDTSAGTIAKGVEVAPLANGLLGYYDINDATPTQTNASNLIFEVIEDAGNDLDDTLGSFAVRVKEVK